MSSSQAPVAESISGLSSAEVAARLKADGWNELPGSKPKSFFQIAFSVIVEPMFLLLVGGSVLYLLLGDLEGGLMLAGFVLVVISITIYQERKTERTLDALRGLASPRALVIRDGQEVRIPGREVVRGDTLILREGDRIPADAVVHNALNLSVDESLLTGESMPVPKHETGEERQLYSSTLVVQGMCVAEATQVGTATRIGQIGKVMAEEAEEKTPLQGEMNRLVKRMTLLAFLTCLLVVGAFYFVRGGLLESLLAGLALAMAMLPEEFPVVFTIFNALGAWRMSKLNVLATKPSAIETLGAATFLCTDKTGTLTQNRMTVKALYAHGQHFRLHDDPKQLIPEDYHLLVEFGILASQTDPFDPMEKAIKRLGDLELVETEHLHHDWELIREFPLSKELLAMSRAFRQPGSSERVIAAKGAPEAIFDLCHLADAEIAAFTEAIHEIAADGLRVIAVARSSVAPDEMPEIQHDFDFEFCGLIGLADPVRPEAAQAVAECRSAGIEVVMITGDYPETAVSIAKEIGMAAPHAVITGAELAAMTDAELAEELKTVRIFARIIPEQKLKLVKALRANGQVVAMTGDGVNDAPALKASHIGIAMGKKGTDVAREAASLVLLDDNFSSIVAAIKQGRRIYDNIQNAFGYIISVHIPIAGLAFFPVAFGQLPLLLWPVHIAFLELVIDPACSVAFERVAAEPDIMRRPPRLPGERFFSSGKVWLRVLNGLVMLGLLLGVFFGSWAMGLTEGQTRTVTFLSLVAGNAGLILGGMSSRQHIFQILRHLNKATVILLAGVAACITLVVAVPGLRNLFQLDLFPPVYALAPLGSTFLLIAWMELAKRLWGTIRK